MADDTNDTDQIERDLAQTRARMDRRLDELGDRLQPNQLVNDALAHVTGGDGSDFAQALIGKAKANPIPAALAGIGIAWLMMSRNQQDHAVAADLPTRLRSAEAGVVRMNDEHPDVHASRLDDARGQVLGLARGASDTAAAYSQRIKDAMASASQSARETSHDLGGGASRTLGRLGGQVRGARQVGSAIALGAGAALVGLIAGALVPVSDQEERMLGGFAGRLRSKGRDLAQDVVNRGAQVAGDALGAAKDSAQAHGLTADRPVGELLGDLKSGDLIGHVKQAAHEVADAGKGSLHSQFGNGSDDQR
jgi:hypothetical protein